MLALLARIWVQGQESKRLDLYSIIFYPIVFIPISLLLCMPKKLIGHIGVDSGTLMLVDPCYVKDYPQIYCHGQKVDKSGKLEWNQTEGLPHLWHEFCKGLNHETPDLMCGGVVTHTRYGDGEFPVFAHFNKHGEIMKLEVRLY